MGILFRKTPAPVPEFTGLQVQTSVNSLPIPIIYGTPRCSANLIYANGFNAQPAGQGHQGKGGGKGLLTGGKSGSGNSYVYFGTLIMALGEGPIYNVPIIFQDQQVYTLSGGPPDATILLFSGTGNQAPWSYIEQLWPQDARNYPYTAYLAMPNYPLDSSATVPQFNFLVQGFYQGTCPLYRANYTIANPAAPSGTDTVTLNLDMDADPATVIYDFLTNPQYGVPDFLPSLIDYNNVFSSANASNPAVGDSALQTYCQAVGFGFSICLNTNEQASSILDRWAKLLGIAIVWNGVILRFIPYWDTYCGTNPGYDSGNERGIPPKYFVPNITPLFDLDDDDFVQGEQGADPITYERVDTADVYNTVNLSFNDRYNLWNNNIAEAKNENDIELNGARVDQLSSANEFSLQQFAANSAQVIVQRNTSIRNRYSFSLSWEYSMLDPMDVVTITDPILGLNRFPVRIISIEEDQRFVLKIVAEEFPIGSQSALLYPKQPYGGGVFNTNIPPQAVNLPFIFEPTAAQLQAQGKPAASVIAIGLSAQNPATGQLDPNWGGADVFISLDNVTYQDVGRFVGVSTQGVLSAPLGMPTGPNPDNVNTLSVNLSESSGELVSFNSAQAAQGISACALYDASGNLEILSYTTATLTAPFTYTLSGLYRGLYGTTPVAAPLGSPFIYIANGDYFQTNLPPQFIGVTLYLKFLSFNIYASEEQSITDVQVYEYVPAGNSIIVVQNPVISALINAEGGSGTTTIDWGLTAATPTQAADFGATTGVLSQTIDYGATM